MIVCVLKHVIPHNSFKYIHIIGDYTLLVGVFTSYFFRFIFVIILQVMMLFDNCKILQNPNNSANHCCYEHCYENFICLVLYENTPFFLLYLEWFYTIRD